MQLRYILSTISHTIELYAKTTNTEASDLEKQITI